MHFLITLIFLDLEVFIVDTKEYFLLLRLIKLIKLMRTFNWGWPLLGCWWFGRNSRIRFYYWFLMCLSSIRTGSFLYEVKKYRILSNTDIIAKSSSSSLFSATSEKLYILLSDCLWPGVTRFVLLFCSTNDIKCQYSNEKSFAFCLRHHSGTFDNEICHLRWPLFILKIYIVQQLMEREK